MTAPPRRAAPESRLPLARQIAAGSPLLAEENVEDEVAVPEPLGRGADFLLRVKGDSMVDAGILDGDTLVVQAAGRPERRDRGGARRRRRERERGNGEDFYREGGRVRLQPENSALEPIFADHVQVLGKVVGVFRSIR